MTTTPKTFDEWCETYSLQTEYMVAVRDAFNAGLAAATAPSGSEALRVELECAEKYKAEGLQWREIAALRMGEISILQAKLAAATAERTPQIGQVVRIIAELNTTGKDLDSMGYGLLAVRVKRLASELSDLADRQPK